MNKAICDNYQGEEEKAVARWFDGDSRGKEDTKSNMNDDQSSYLE